jgi:hypothetical protein
MIWELILKKLNLHKSTELLTGWIFVMWYISDKHNVKCMYSYVLYKFFFQEVSIKNTVHYEYSTNHSLLM